VIRFKAVLQHSYGEIAPGDIRLINPELLSSIDSQYSTLFKSNVVMPATQNRQN
jgi:hypothetical protein